MTIISTVDQLRHILGVGMLALRFQNISIKPTASVIAVGFFVLLLLMGGKRRI